MNADGQPQAKKSDNWEDMEPPTGSGNTTRGAQESSSSNRATPPPPPPPASLKSRKEIIDEDLEALKKKMGLK